MSIRRTAALLLMSTATLALGACGGADDVASPGEGNLIVIAPPAPAPSTPAPPPPPAAGGPFTGAAPAGFIDRGVVNNRRVFEMPSRFTQDTTLQNIPGAVYSISGPVNVGSDVGGDGNAAGGNRVTLTIQPGTIVIASAGNDYLVVNRGSRINAAGTATSPIIFTARANLEGTVTDSSQGLWGGIILLGRAPISDCNAAVPGGSANCQQVIEGTTSSLYGGNVPTDNSGTLQYVQIRYSGFAIAPGNELQGLTTGGVGSNTTINHVQVHNSSDDGVEFFGGRQNAKYLVITGADDDGLDTDLGYRGTMQFVIGIQRDAGNGDSMIEADSNGNEDALPRQYTRVSNATFVQRGNTQGGNTILLRGGTDYALLNSVVTGPQACLDIDATGGTTARAADAALQDVGPPVFRSVVLSCPTAFRDDNNVTTAEVAAIFGTGTNNNNSAFTSTLANVFINGANETAGTATDPRSFNADAIGGANTSAPNQLENVSYIGAVRNAQDNWYAGWTCSAGYAPLGTPSCTTLPANS
ncbi:MAG TPA: hypothetical protein VEZ48_10995 [Sphingomonadaceae bacterium]|jgi:hypothetical protein|nr:hypothetical protein [Sphingomonadaceae bacterium]